MGDCECYLFSNAVVEGYVVYHLVEKKLRTIANGLKISHSIP